MTPFWESYDAVGILQTVLIPLVGWIGVRIERVLRKVTLLEHGMNRIDTDLKVLTAEERDHQEADDRRFAHLDDDVRYLIRRDEGGKKRP